MPHATESTDQNSQAQPELAAESSPTAVIRTAVRLKRRSGSELMYPGWLSRARGAGTVLISASSILFLLLVGCALLLLYGKSPPPKMIAGAVIPVGVVAEIFALLALLLQIVQGVVGLWIDHRRTNFEEVLTCEQDMDHAQRLSKASDKSLEAAEAWIKQQMANIDSHVAQIFGGSEKIALFALTGTAWTVWKELPKEWLPQWGLPILCFLAFFTGLALGGLALRRRLSRLSYQRDLVELARMLKESA